MKKSAPSSSRSKKGFFNRFMASFAVTGAVIGAAVVFKPEPIIAEFIALEVYGNSIYYEVNVEDESSIVVEGSLKITIENHREYYEIIIDKGVRKGNYFGLNPNTVYTISIKVNEGYGEKTLISSTITTYESMFEEQE